MYRGAKCPTKWVTVKQPKNSRVSVKQPKNSRKNTWNTRKAAVLTVFRVFRLFFWLFFGCFAAAHLDPFRLFFGCFQCRAFGTSVDGGHRDRKSNDFGHHFAGRGVQDLSFQNIICNTFITNDSTFGGLGGGGETGDWGGGVKLLSSDISCIPLRTSWICILTTMLPVSMQCVQQVHFSASQWLLKARAKLKYTPFGDPPPFCKTPPRQSPPPKCNLAPSKM